ncbi:MAG: hypothetical protein ACOC92_02100 [bacterium]
MAKSVEVRFRNPHTSSAGAWSQGEEDVLDERLARGLESYGIVEILGDAEGGETVETADAPRTAENTDAPQIEHLGGGWYLVAGEKVQGREAAERKARGE